MRARDMRFFRITQPHHWTIKGYWSNFPEFSGTRLNTWLQSIVAVPFFPHSKVTWFWSNPATIKIIQFPAIATLPSYKSCMILTSRKKVRSTWRTKVMSGGSSILPMVPYPNLKKHTPCLSVRRPSMQPHLEAFKNTHPSKNSYPINCFIDRCDRSNDVPFYPTTSTTHFILFFHCSGSYNSNEGKIWGWYVVYCPFGTFCYPSRA
jgi:hypothetical protein